MRGQIRMKTRMPVKQLLATLEQNRNNHASIVAEARAGYLERARQALEEKLAELKSGRMAELVFRLSPPADYTKTYDTAIGMLTQTVDETVELDAEEFSNLVQDEWDWSASFFGLNKMYSGTASMLALQKGY